jgi:hypothetical protein
MIVEVTPATASGVIFGVRGAPNGVCFRSISITVETPFSPGARLEVSCGDQCLNVPLDERHSYVNPETIKATDDLKMEVDIAGSPVGKAFIYYYSEVL